MSSLPLQIAIDGPVASGKSTVARSLAQRLGCIFLDTGALYRAVAYEALRSGIRYDDETHVSALLGTGVPRVELDPSSPIGYWLCIGGRKLAAELFTPEVSRAASAVAAMPSVRRRLLPVQREFADERTVIMAGRDIGSVVLPDAGIKFFLTASVDSRVDRRFKELEAKGEPIDRETLRLDIELRDQRDRTRPVSPLLEAPGAIVVDTSAMTVAQVTDALERIVRARAHGDQTSGLYRFAKWLIRAISRPFFDAQVTGEANVPKDGPLVVAANHRSYLDPPLLGAWFPRTVHYMAKKELFSTPILGPTIRAVHAFPVNREEADLGSVRRALHILRDGGVVGIFPEGRRNLGGTAQPKGGAVLLASMANCPLVPVHLSRTYLAMRKLRGAHVRVVIGEPMTFQGTQRKPTKAELADWTIAVTNAIAALETK